MLDIYFFSLFSVFSFFFCVLKYELADLIFCLFFFFVVVICLFCKFVLCLVDRTFFA